MSIREIRCAALVAMLAFLWFVCPAGAQERVLHSFDRKQLADVYYSEGAAVGDINRDGQPDIIYGPYWYEGPTFEKKHEIYEPKPQPTNFYADNFFTWVYDFNGDGWPDLLVVGLPGTPAFIFENPAGKSDGHWKKHQVFDSVGNESPHFVDLLGGKRPVLVCTHKGEYGFVVPNWAHPFEAWTWHGISDNSIREKLPHGLGVGDLNGDGRADVLIATGWFEQPATNAASETWAFHPVPFTNAYGGAEMYVYDVNGDGRNDVITSLAAHDFGLAWFEQIVVRGKPIFRQHIIVGEHPEQNPYGIVFSEPHSVALADIDGDGLKDIITGKTYWSHHKASPQWDAGAVVYWFSLARNKDDVQWIPHLADPDAGIGRQIRIDDVNGDKLPDIVVGGMKGAHLLTHRTKTVDQATWDAAQPKLIYPQLRPLRRGPDAPLASGKWEGALEAEDLPIVGTPPGQTNVQDMTVFTADQWSGGKQLFWSGAKTGDRLELEIKTPQAGEYDLQAIFTMARDFAVLQPLIDGKPIGGVLDLYNFPDVLTTGILTLGRAQLTAGSHRFGIEIKGANPSASAGGNRVGLDAVKLVRVGDAGARAEVPPSKRLLVVAPERFHAALAEYVSHKQQWEPAEFVSLEKVLATTAGADDPERLKRFLYTSRKNLGYVLLVGDVDVMPVRYMVLDRVTPAAFDYAFYPSDLYYADIEKADGTFDDWNASKDGFHARYFGEVRGEKNKSDPINFDHISYHPTMAVGRWPVSTVDEVRIVAAKSMAYEDAVCQGHYAGADKVAIFHPRGWVDARQRLDRLAHAMPAAWHSQEFLYGGSKSGPASPTQENVLAALNGGTGLILHAGHGSEVTWEGCFSMNALPKIQNADRLPVVMSAGCSTAYFAPLAPYDGYVDADGHEHAGTTAGEVFKEPPPPPAPYQRGKHNPTGLGEQLLKHDRNGAVVYIGCCTGSQPCGLTLLDGFAAAVTRGSGETRVGDCWSSAIRYYYDTEHLATLKPDSGWYPPSIFFQGMKFMFFGDPSLPLPIKQ